jgi:hypothetical protein
MAHDMRVVRKPVQSTWQQSPTVFPTKIIVDYRDKDGSNDPSCSFALEETFASLKNQSAADDGCCLWDLG